MARDAHPSIHWSVPVISLRLNYLDDILFPGEYAIVFVGVPPHVNTFFDNVDCHIACPGIQV
jgi:hypothetical protein